MVRPIFFIFALWLLAGVIYAQHGTSSAVIPASREAWIQSGTVLLRQNIPDSLHARFPVTEKLTGNQVMLSVRIRKNGIIPLPGDQRIIIITSSSHDNPEVGDISLAIDRHRRVYQNNGHVCGGIIHFETGKIRKLKNSRQFFRYFVSDTDGEGWKRIR